MAKEAIVVGCGLTGSTIARLLADNGFHVTIFEKREHVGGNMYDFYDENGVLVHKYGPHTFHTNNKELVDFIEKYSEWVSCPLKCGAIINGICTPTPFNFKTIDSFFPDEAQILKNALLAEFNGRELVTVIELLNSKNVIIRKFAEFLFENDYRLYTAKQWGCSPEIIDKSVLNRVPIRLSYQEGYFDDFFQIVPKDSYMVFFKSLLNHKNIDIRLNVDARDFFEIKGTDLCYKKKRISFPVVWTGPVDELFQSRFGTLPYRSLRFVFVHENIDSKQKYGVVAYPQEKDFTRIVEFKKITNQKVSGTTYEIEYPLTYDGSIGQEPYYPVLTEESMYLNNIYQNLAQQINFLFLCGRLGNFKYYNMDQALEIAIKTANDIINLFKW